MFYNRDGLPGAKGDLGLPGQKGVAGPMGEFGEKVSNDWTFFNDF